MKDYPAARVCLPEWIMRFRFAGMDHEVPVVDTFDRLLEEARAVLATAEADRIRTTYRPRLRAIDWRRVHAGKWANFEVIERLEHGVHDLTGAEAAKALEPYAQQLLIMAGA